MKTGTIDLYEGQPPPLIDGTLVLLKVGGEYITATADYGGYTTKLGRYISPHDIDEYGVLPE